MARSVSSSAPLSGSRSVAAIWARRDRILGGPGSLALYLLATLLLAAPMLADPAGRILDGGTDDPAQTTWFFGVFAHLLVHGHNPLSTDYLQYPDGINLMWNASMPLLGLIALPITLTAGPLLSENLLIVIGVTLTAWATRFWLRRHVGPFPAFIGGLLVAFSPYAVGQLQHHLGQAVLPFVPLMFMLCEDLFWRRPRRQWITGGLLGAATAAQALINSELVLIIALGMVITILIAGASAPRRFARSIVPALPGIGAAAVAFLVVYGFPLWVQFRDGRMSSLYTTSYVAEPEDFVLPAPHTWLDFAHRGDELLRRGTGSWEIGSYLGVALIAVLLVVIVLLCRRLDVRVAAIVLVIMSVLSLGDRLRIGVTYHGPSLPWTWVSRLPGMFGVLPARLSVVSSIAVAYLVAVGLDAGIRELAGWPRRVAVGAVVLSLVPLLPASLPIGESAGVPSGFAAAVRQLPAGSAIVTLPVAEPHSQRPMLWVAESGMRVRLVGGAAKRPTETGAATSYARSTPLTIWAHDVTFGQPVSDVLAGQAHDWMIDNHVRALVLARGYVTAAAYAEAVRMLGPPTSTHADVLLWKVG